MVIDSLNLPPAFKKSISRAIFQHPGPKLSITVTSAMGELQPQTFPPWKTGKNTDIIKNIVYITINFTLVTASAINSLRDNHITPRPFWRDVSNKKETQKLDSLIRSKTIMLPPI